MKLARRFAILLVSISCTSVVNANPILIGDKEWRQVTDTIGFNWNEVATVCDPATGICSGILGDVDFTDWIWADIGDVGDLLSQLTPHPGGFANIEERNSSWAPQLLSLFDATYVREVDRPR